MELTNIDLINISQFLISIMMTVVFLLAWKIMEKKTYVLMWAFFYLFAATNGILNAANDLFPDRNIYWVVVNGVSLITQILALIGYRMRAGKLPFPVLIIAYFIIIELLVIWFTFYMPHMGLRMVFIPYSAALVVMAIAYEIWRVDRPLRLAEKSTAVLFLLYAIVQITSGTLALLQGTERNEYYLSLYSQTNFLFMPAFFAGLGLFTLLILVDDLADKMKLQAVTDYLTKLLNRRGFKQQADTLVENFQNTDQTISVVVTDIDLFKNINDQYGHQIGDEVLQSVSTLLSQNCPESTIIGRIGGEEFALLIPNHNLTQAVSVAEKLRQMFAKLTIKTNGNQRITASFGVAEITDSIEHALQNADKAMYQAKRDGRNQVKMHS